MVCFSFYGLPTFLGGAYYVKKILSFLLCFIIPFIFLRPLSSIAFDVQGTEYSEPGLLPPDIDFSEYDYYFLTVSGTPENPTYFLYLIKDTSDVGRMYFTIAKSASSTNFRIGEFTSFGITTNYECILLANNKVSGLWNSRSLSSADYSGFVFDGYSDFTSSSKYIIGSNCSIYSYSGNLIRSGDYDLLNFFFLGGLQGSSDRTEKPTEPIVTTPSGGDSSYFDELSEFYGNISDSLVSILNAIKSIDVSVNFDDDFKSIFDSILTQVTNIFTSNQGFFNDFQREVDTIELYLSEIKNSFLEFISIGGDVKKLADFFSEVNVSISNVLKTSESYLSDINNFLSDIKDNTLSIRMGIDDLKSRIPSDFDSIIKSIKDNISLIKLGIDNLNKKIPSDFANIMGVIKDSVTTIRIKIDSVVDSVSDLSGKLSDIYSELNDISYYSKWINNNIRDYLGKIFDSVDSISSILDSYCVNVSSNIFSILGSVDKIKDLLFTYCKGMAECVVSIKDSVLSLPEDLKSLLKELFIPKGDHFAEFDDLKNHFGFVRQITEMGDVLVNRGSFDSVPLDYTFEVNHSLFGHFSFSIDFSVIPVSYIEFARNLIRGIVLIVFVRRTRKRLPRVINGD